MSRVGPLVEMLTDIHEARAVRVYGLVCDPEDARHREVVVYASSAAGARGRLARCCATSPTSSRLHARSHLSRVPHLRAAAVAGDVALIGGYPAWFLHRLIEATPGGREGDARALRRPARPARRCAARVARAR
jgi:hypothetical protein